jgi:crotonobetainyl-CoA:carnitine CoA-transferase CaiB-like acyl-CoA transferase
MTLRVLELGGAAAGYAGRLFVHLGAEVVRLSEPEPDAGTYEGMLFTCMVANSCAGTLVVRLPLPRRLQSGTPHLSIS